MTPEISDAQSVAVRRFGTEGAEVAVFEFEGKLRDLIVANLRESLLASGRYTRDARTVSPQAVQALAFAGGGTVATGVSAAFSSTVFMATANPATLMQLSSGGVGSAVMGAGGIVGQAGFIPVAASLPVVAPILAMQAIQTAMMLQQFGKLDQKLDAIKGTLDEAIARSEATHAGELIAASEMVDEVYQQYDLIGMFSNDMLVRLALAERDLRALVQRFRFLADTYVADQVEDIVAVQRANYDAHSALLSSFLELRIAYLRVCVDMEANPRAAAVSVDRLTERIRSAVGFWEQTLKRSEQLRAAITDREKKLNDMNWVQRTLPEFIGGQGAAADRKLKALRDAYTSTLENELAIIKDFDALIRSAKQTLAELESAGQSREEPPTLVYWRDEAGEHSFSTTEMSALVAEK
ncbi:MAG TPA: hypothetical protein VL294_09690 [Pseudolysinimonas sp.]|jgi:hypothetical protein|nr:hypothetical protein [Pseudolysinimonas sp.]